MLPSTNSVAPSDTRMCVRNPAFFTRKFAFPADHPGDQHGRDKANHGLEQIA